MADDWTLEADDGAIDRLIRQALDAITAGVKLVATDLWGNIREESPVDEGRLSGSWQMQGGGLQYRIYTNVLYALFVYEGTGIFGPSGTPIVPVTASALRFEVGGGVVFAKSVRGQQPNRYLDRAEERTRSRIDMFADLALNEVGL